MKKLLTITLTSLFLCSFAQYSGNDNTFRNNEVKEQNDIKQEDPTINSPGNPGDPTTSIDNFLPFLLIFAGVGICFSSRKYLKNRE